jgi:ATP-dependent RNA helicase DeaD
VAISLVDVIEKAQLNRIAQRYHIEMLERPLPTREDVAAVVAERTTILLEAKRRQRDKLQTERMQRFVPLVHDLSKNEEGEALLAMLLDDYYQQSLHNPPPIIEPRKSAPKSKPGKPRGGRRRRRRKSNK